MTKKHFIELADAIRYHNSTKSKNNRFNVVHLSMLAEFCRRQNPRFKESRWFMYIAGECGPNGGSLKPKPKPKKQKPQVCEDCLGIDSHEPNCLKQTEVRK
jgi:hypothetical protein